MRYDWDRYGRPRTAWFNRVMRWVLPPFALVIWVRCLPLIARDWTVIFPPLIMTFCTVMHQVGVRKLYAARPDHAAIARMERALGLRAKGDGTG